MTKNLPMEQENKTKLDNSWWKLTILPKKTQSDKVDLPKLSAHVLNLRSGLLPDTVNQGPAYNKVEIAPDRAELVAIKSKINLAINKPRVKLPKNVADLTFIWMFELSVWLLTSWWRVVFSILFDTVLEAINIFDSIRRDIVNYFAYVWQVITWPWRKVFKRRTYRTDSAWYTFQESFDLRQLKWLIITTLVIILPVKVFATWQTVNQRQHQIINLSQDGVNNLKSGNVNLLAGNTEQAQLDYASAAAKFTEAQDLTKILPAPILNLLAVIPGKPQQVIGGVYLVSASKELAVAASSTLGLWHQLSSKSLLVDITKNNNVTLLEDNINQINNHLSLASLYLEHVQPENIPADISDQVMTLKDELRRVKKVVSSLGTMPDLLRQAFVSSEEKRYLLIFQNNSEMRATGGFMGSLAFVNIKGGKVENFSMPGGGPYDFQGQIKKIIRPPEPVRLVRGTWQLQDSNWWLDFPTSAKKVMWFIQQSDGPQVDGVLAVTPDVVMELLKLTGPIELKKYNKVITAENFMRTTQLAVDVEYDKVSNRPKQFLVDLAPLLMERLINLPQAEQINLIQIMQESLLRKSLQLYFVNEDLQKQISDFGWSGQIKDTPGDYLAIVHTNIGGGKTDLVTKEGVTYNVKIDNEGQVIANLSIQREHTGNPSDIFEKRRNVDYLRIYVPRGSVLIAASGFTPPPDSYFRAVPPDAVIDEDLVGNEDLVAYHQSSGTRITEEFGKTAFANWLSVAPGEKKTINLTYKLPIILKSGTGLTGFKQYQLFLQRQPGMQPVNFEAQVDYPESWRVRWQESSAKLSRLTNSLKLSSEWIGDDYLAVLFDDKINQ